MIPKICLFAIVCALIAALLDSFGFKSKGLFGLLCVLIMFISLSESFGNSFFGILSVAEKAGISDAASCILRAIGLGYIFGFTSEICSSVGEQSIASAVQAAGKIQIFLVAYPYFEKIIDLGVGMLE